MPDLSTSVQFAPLALFAGLVFFKVLFSKSILDALGSLFEPDGLLFILFIPLLTIAPSVASGSKKSFESALVISVYLILARLYMAVVPVREVLEAFFWSGILSVGTFIPLSFAAFTQSIETLARFSAFSFHPNLLGFVLAGYFCAMVWKFMTSKWHTKILAGLVGFSCLVIIFFASSRGAIAGIVAGSLLIAGMAIAGFRKELRKKALQLALLAAAASLILFFFIQNLEWAQNAYAFVDRVLELSNKFRGIDTGLSGRFDQWSAAARVLSDGTWLVGHGFRSSDTLFAVDQWIDNSYLVILYETGLLSAILISWRFFDVSRRFMRGYFHAASEDQRYLYLACSMLMVVFLVNNIVARYLFAIGNPFSLLAFFLFTAPTIQRKQRMQRAGSPVLPRQVANWSASKIPPSYGYPDTKTY